MCAGKKKCDLVQDLHVGAYHHTTAISSLFAQVSLCILHPLSSFILDSYQCPYLAFKCALFFIMCSGSL